MRTKVLCESAGGSREVRGLAGELVTPPDIASLGGVETDPGNGRLRAGGGVGRRS